MNDGVGGTVGPDEIERANSFLTAEHAALQSARLGTVIDSNGRLADFVSVVSATVIALAFIGQTSKFGASFYLFALTMLPVLAILGVFTFLRTLQIRIEDSYFALAINRVRHYYLEAAPHTRPYLLLPGHDTMGDVTSMGVHSSRLTPMLMVAGTVAFVNSAIFGTFAALGARAALETSTSVSVVIGALTFALSLAIHHFYQRHKWHTMHASYKPAFPNHVAEPSAK